jgi:ribosomal protein S18 acetylase RimI-like enzyme
MAGRTNMLQIRRYQPEDKETVKAIHYAGLAQFGADINLQEHAPYNADLDNIEAVYLEAGGDFLVGIRDGEIVAMGAIRRITATCVEIKRIRVRQDCQRRGYGQAILSRLMELAEERGYTEIRLDTVANNTPAQLLFEKFGFVESHRGKLGRFEIIFYGKKITTGKRL